MNAAAKDPMEDPRRDPIRGVTFQGDPEHDLTIPRDRPLLAPLVRMAVLDLEHWVRDMIHVEALPEGAAGELRQRARAIAWGGLTLELMSNDSGLGRDETILTHRAGETLMVLAAALTTLDGELPPGLSGKALVWAAWGLLRQLEKDVEQLQGLTPRKVLT